MLRKKFKNINLFDLLWFVILLLPLIVPLFTTFINAIAYSGQTGSFTANISFIGELENAFTHFTNILGLNTFNTWFYTNLLNVSNPNFYAQLPILYGEYTIFIYLIHMSVEFLLFLPNVVGSFFDKMGGEI